MNTGHEALSCRECYLPAEGTAAQQASSKVYSLAALRDSFPGRLSRPVSEVEITITTGNLGGFGVVTDPSSRPQLWILKQR